MHNPAGDLFFKSMDPVFSLDSLLHEFQPFQISLPAAAYYPELIEMLPNMLDIRQEI